MDIVEVIKQDYKNFPNHQSYEIYANDVTFADPLTKFQGLDRYQKMIKFLDSFFGDINLELHKIEQKSQLIITEWTLTMAAPLPWKPILQISGSSELLLDEKQMIISHVDRWQISPWRVLMQNFRFNPRIG